MGKSVVTERCTNDCMIDGRHIVAAYLRLSSKNVVSTDEFIMLWRAT